jgi:hypothetical protein
MFSLRSGTAERCYEVLGIDPPVGLSGLRALVEAFGCSVPMGTTAKLEAVGRGETPYGADPQEIASRWLADPDLAWSCWAASTFFSGLVNSVGSMTATVTAARRIDPMAPAVDFHSQVLVDLGGERFACDPHFGVGPIAIEGGEFLRPGVWSQLVDVSGARILMVGVASNGFLLRYRIYSDALSHGDVRAFCELSRVFSGVPNRPRLTLLKPDGLQLLLERPDGKAVSRRWTLGNLVAWGSCRTETYEGWEPALRELRRTT